MRRFRRAQEVYQNKGMISLIGQSALYVRRKLLDDIRYFYHYFRSDGDSIIKTINGSQMDLRFGTRGIERTLISKQMREPDATAYLSEVYRHIEESYPGKVTVFDIGANIGYYALLAGRVFNSKTDIHAYEPERGNVDRLKMNILLNDYSNIQTHQRAIGGTSGEAILSISDYSTLHTLIDEDREPSEGEREVPITTIDTEIDSLVDHDGLLISRIDVEGHEVGVVEGMTSLLNSERDCFVFIEIHPTVDEEGIEFIKESFLSSGFTILFNDGGGAITDWSVGENYHVAAFRGENVSGKEIINRT